MRCVTTADATIPQQLPPQMKPLALSLAVATFLQIAVPTVLAQRWVRLSRAANGTAFDWDGVLYAFPVWNAICVLAIGWLTYRLVRRRLWPAWVALAASVLFQTVLLVPLLVSPVVFAGRHGPEHVIPSLFLVPGVYLLVTSAMIGFLWLMSTPRRTAVA